MKSIKQLLSIAISTILGLASTNLQAKEYGPLQGNGIVLNDGDSIVVDDNNTLDPSLLEGINSSTPGAGVTINGAANITVKSDKVGTRVTSVSLANGSTNNLGSNTSIISEARTGLSDAGVANALLVKSKSTVYADHITITSKSHFSALLSNVKIEDQSTINFGKGSTITTETSGIGRGIMITENSNFIADSITIDTKYFETSFGLMSVYVTSSSTLDLGSNSTIRTTSIRGQPNNYGVYTDSTSKVTADQLTIDSTNATGINVLNGASVDLGSNSIITTKSIDNDYNRYAVSVSGSGSNVKAKQLTTKTNGERANALMAENDGLITIGAGSHIATEKAYGIQINSGVESKVDFLGDESNRNTIISHGEGSAWAKAGIINIKNTDINITADNSPQSIGLKATNNSVINAENVSIQAITPNTYALQAGDGSKINLTGNTTIIAGTHEQSALATQGNNATISGKSKINITGNIHASGNNSAINLTMNPNSTFTGYATTDAGAHTNLTITDSTWNMTNNSTVSLLALNNTHINFTKPNFNFANPSFSTLNIDSLTGNGIFSIHTDIVAGKGDLIQVKGTATGDHKLNIANNGSATTSGDETLTVVTIGNEALNVVTTDSNQANFTLTNKVELGAFEYSLRAAPSNANNMELYASGPKQLTSTAQTATSFLNIGYLTNYVENQTLLQRLGELRHDTANSTDGNLWVRSFGGKLSSFSGTQLSGFDMSYFGTQAGIDKQLDVNQGSLIIGAMAGYTRTNPNYRAGNGNGKNYTAGLYTTYFLNNGLYVDTLLKYNSMHNHFSVKDTAGNNVNGTGKTQGISLSTEVGKRFWLMEQQQGYYIEPQAQLTYGYQSGDSVGASNGLNIGLSHYNSTLGRVSAVAGYQTQGANPINIYLKSGYVREFDGASSYTFNGGAKNSHNFRSGWWDNGIGTNININKQHNIYAELDYATGNRFDQKQINIGYRYSF